MNWTQSTNWPLTKTAAKPEEHFGFPTFPQPNPRPNMDFKGVDLRLLESIFHKEEQPDFDWLLEISRFTQKNVDEVAKWFITRKLKVYIFWEGHQIFQNLHLTLWSARQK